MNELLNLKLRFTSENNNQKPGARNIKHGNVTSYAKIDSLCEDLKMILNFYKRSEKFVNGILIDVNYNDIIAKSNRIQALLKPNGKKVNNCIVGARFSDAPEGKENHIITYYVDSNTVEETLNQLLLAKQFLNDQFHGEATVDNFDIKNKINYSGYELSKSKLRDIIVDCSVIDSFSVPHISASPDRDTFLITFYKTELSARQIIEKLKLDLNFSYQYSMYGNDTISVNKNVYDFLEANIPYLISMVSSDFSKLTLRDIEPVSKEHDIYIPDPTNEATIGVIDTLFDENVYFSKWVENTDYLDEYEKAAKDLYERDHGTKVTSLIVDGPRMNPWLNDGCGRFKVRHFGVCDERISTLKLVKKIREIVESNPDIHVWNLSLGNEDEVSKNFISYDGAFLDQLQAEKNIIFVIAGTNDNRNEKEDVLKVGSPADSLNSIVVNSVRRDGTPASYSRKGNVLSFYNKPDVSYYGGDYDERMTVYAPNGEVQEYGTSFAAPWISRKLCYLIDVIGLPKEVAKALIIDSAAGWEYKSGTYRMMNLIGYGVVPINISKILSSENEEIKFMLYGTSKSYRTTNYAIPVPKDANNKYPYLARATLCYFPECSRLQGVDYTNRELSFTFGRVKPDKKIKDINENVQDETGTYTDERTSRKEFRKWENTKFISNILKDKKRALKSFDDSLWGISIVSKERLTTSINKDLNFGIVITLKEINGVNRINDFINACSLRGWIISKVDVNNQVEIFNTNQEEIVLD